MPRKPKGACKNAPFLLVCPAPLRSAGCRAVGLSARSSPAGCFVCLPAGCAAPSVFAVLRLGRGALGVAALAGFWAFVRSFPRLRPSAVSYPATRGLTPAGSVARTRLSPPPLGLRGWWGFGALIVFGFGPRLAGRRSPMASSHGRPVAFASGG